MKKYIGFILLSIGSWVLLSGWGYSGHEKIGKGASASFDPLMSQFHEWTQIIADHSADADKRKSWDGSEGIKHYIDIDNYTIFVETGRISQDKDSLVSRYGSVFVNQQGTLPWTTKITFDTLVSCFTRHDFDKAVLVAADLSHYVGDGHMPLHITSNYDGQYSNNKGIHSQYESSMIGRYVNQIQIEGKEVHYVDNVQNYIFDYLYATYPYIDSVLLADDYARSVNSNTSSTEYLAALWEKTESFTVELFNDASLSLANLIYTAWVTAGSPSFDDHTFSKYLDQPNFNIQTIYCKYPDSTLSVKYNLAENMEIDFGILTMNGEKIRSLNLGETDSGIHHSNINISGLTDGLYLLLMNGNGQSLTQKFLIK